ncbi:MAG: hypothetical protein JXA30_12265 [Deltaproteobacteria bacterium]|nr:hypothetical protein [Deltaproteobacteria bacterium]
MKRFSPLICLAVFLAIGMSVGCTVTETGNPSVDTKSIYLQKADSGVRMVGEEKAVMPGDSQLRIVNLDNLSEPVDITVNKDGSFEVLLDGSIENVFRLRSLYRGRRSEPVNLSGVEIEEPECITSEPSDRLDFSDTKLQNTSEKEIVLTNACDENVRLIEESMRLRSNAIEIQALDLPRVIKPGESLSIEVSFTPTLPGEYEAIAVLVFESQGRMAIDIFGRASGESRSLTSLIEAKAGVCYGAKTDCSSHIEPILSGYVPAKTAVIEEIASIDIEWFNVIEEADCPLPPCCLFSPQLAVAPDGSVSIAAKVTMDATSSFPENSGFWFARYSAEGELLKQAFIDFAIPSPSGYTEYTPSLAVDSEGNTFLAVLSQLHPKDQVAEDGELSVYKYSPEGELLGVPITRYGVRYPYMYGFGRASSIFIDPQDNLILVSHYRNREAPDPPEPQDPAMHEEYPPATKVDITMYDRNGNLIWNQSGLNQEATSTRIGELRFDAEGNIILAVDQSYGDEQARQWSIARLDGNGNYIWTRALPDPQSGSFGEVHVAASGDGSSSVLYTLLLDDLDETTNVFMDSYNANGGATWSWELSGDYIDIPALQNYGSTLNIIRNTDGTSIVALQAAGSKPVIYSFSSDGESYSVSDIDLPECSATTDAADTSSWPLCVDLALYSSTTSSKYFTAGNLVFGKLGQTTE